jgi:hypothetical protein
MNESMNESINQIVDGEHRTSDVTSDRSRMPLGINNKNLDQSSTKPTFEQSSTV